MAKGQNTNIKMEQTAPKNEVERNETYDNIFKGYIQDLSDKVIISFINSMFGKNFPINSKVTRLNKENIRESRGKSKNGKKPIFADLYIGIENELFHMEMQTEQDNTMALRMFEYGFYGAYQHGRTETEDGMKLKFPAPVVVYLKSNPNTPNTLKIELELPGGETANFKIPTICMKDLSVKEICEKNLYPIAAFYSFKHFNSKKSEPLKEDIKEMCSALKEAEKKGLLKPSEAGDLIDKTIDIAKRIVKQSKMPDEKEVLKFMDNMETVRVRDTLGVYKEGEKQGIEKGRTEGIIKTVRSMHKHNTPLQTILDIAKEQGLSEAEVYTALKIQPQKEKTSLTAKVNEKKTEIAKTPRKKAVDKQKEIE